MFIAPLYELAFLPGSRPCRYCDARLGPWQAQNRGVEPFFPSPHTTRQATEGVIRTEGKMLHPRKGSTLGRAESILRYEEFVGYEIALQ
jgi:hypothetical protein